MTWNNSATNYDEHLDNMKHELDKYDNGINQLKGIINKYTNGDSINNLADIINALSNKAIIDKGRMILNPNTNIEEMTAGAAIVNDKLCIVGGKRYAGGSYSSTRIFDIDIYNYKTRQWTRNKLTYPMHHNAIGVYNNLIYYASNEVNQVAKKICTYNPETNENNIIYSVNDNSLYDISERRFNLYQDKFIFFLGSRICKFDLITKTIMRENNSISGFRGTGTCIDKNNMYILINNYLYRYDLITETTEMIANNFPYEQYDYQYIEVVDDKIIYISKKGVIIFDISTKTLHEIVRLKNEKITSLAKGKSSIHILSGHYNHHEYII